MKVICLPGEVWAHVSDRHIILGGPGDNGALAYNGKPLSLAPWLK